MWRNTLKRDEFHLNLKAPGVSLSFKLVPVPYREYENDLLPTPLCDRRCSLIRRSNPEVVGSNPIEVEFSLARGDSQISFKGVTTQGNLMYRQYCLLPAPKH